MGTNYKARWARILGLAVMTVKFKAQRHIQRLGCAFGRHDWEPAPALDKDGKFDCSRPGRYFRCRRPDCQVIRGPVKLAQIGHWQETADFMVIIDLQCRACWGRGYTGLMNLPDGMQARVPCKCLRVQPAFLQVATNGSDRRKLRKQVEEAVVGSGR